MYERLSKYGLLILDDLGKEKPSERVVELTFSIINTRYESMLPMIITTNYSMKDLAARMTVKGGSKTTDAIISRIFETCDGDVTTFEGGDKRTASSRQE